MEDNNHNTSRGQTMTTEITINAEHNTTLLFTVTIDFDSKRVEVRGCAAIQSGYVMTLNPEGAQILFNEHTAEIMAQLFPR